MLVHNVVSMLYVMWCPQIFFFFLIYMLCGISSPWSPRRLGLVRDPAAARLLPLQLRVSYESTFNSYPLLTRLNFHIKSRNLGLPSERVASINMHSIAYLSPQLFRIVQRFPRTARGCVDWVRCSCSTPFRDRISAAPPCCSPDAHSLGILPRRVFGEQRGGAAEILSRNGVEHGPYSIYTFSGGIRTHLYLLEM